MNGVTIQEASGRRNETLSSGVSSGEPQDEHMMAVGTDWLGRVRQLLDFAQENGHTRVPKRYQKNPSLANWVSKQRQQYRRFVDGKTPCSLTAEQIQLLDQIGFCWDASNYTLDRSTHDNEDVKSRKEDELWWERMNELSRSNYSTALDVPRNCDLGVWLQAQRNEYKTWGDDQADRLDALRQFDSYWHQTRRERQWEIRYGELQRYRREHGDCCVPISYQNKQLAHWVSNQRKQWNLRRKGEKSDMTLERIQKLDSIGFTWSRWDDSF